MTLKINYNSKLKDTIQSTNVFFVSEKIETTLLKNFFNKSEFETLSLLIKKKEFSKQFLSLDLSTNKNITLIKKKKEINEENLGAEFYNYLKLNNFKNISIYIDSLKDLEPNISNKFLHGFRLKSYEFDLYKSKKNDNKIFVNIISKEKKANLTQLKFQAIEEGTNFARNLVSEPPNVLYPKEYVNRLLKLKKIGVRVTVYNEAKLKKLGMNSLLGVGRGSSKESFLVTLEWYGNKKNKTSPLSFVGKGVCFDTGGISLKPAKFMEETKYDMAGSAVVSGLIQSLALRKAKVNAVGVVGLVENMPGGNAQRPGDIVKAYNGKTIEVLNTDAEGRLVLADALSFTEKKFKPKFIIDLATLTGAIIVALGEEYAGLFSNNDELSKKLSEAGEKVNEKVWRLPLHKNYDKLMDSTIADIQNINYSGGAGSITAAQFLQRFVEKTPWAHLDIAGMAFSKKAANLNPGGATGFGVRLLNQLIEDYYE